jgi:DNA-binding CsgD family transcriptional regulator
MSRLTSLIIDTADVLSQAATSEQRWWAINRVARKIGANAVNAGAFQCDTKEIAWVRSSMDPRWLEEYEADAFDAADPLLDGVLSCVPEQRFDFRQLGRTLGKTSKAGHMSNAVLAYEYNYMISNTWADGGSGKCVAVAFEHDPDCLFGPGSARAFATISAMMAVALLPPGDDLHEGWAWGTGWQSLVARERDVLSFVYQGLPEYMIAETMRITEFEVWSLIHSASRKMRARTRSQAVALAISRGQVEP